MLTKVYDPSSSQSGGTATPTGRWPLGQVVRSVVGLPLRTGRAVLAAPTYIADLGRQAADLVSGAQETIARIAVLVDAVEVLVAGISRTAAHAAGVATLADAVAMDSSKVVLKAEHLLNRTGLLLDLYEPVLTGVHPTAAHAAVVVKPQHVDSIAQLMDLVPELLELITPALRGMGNLSPELGELADRFETIGAIVEGLPGAGILKRRGSEHDDDE